MNHVEDSGDEEKNATEKFTLFCIVIIIVVTLLA